MLEYHILTFKNTGVKVPAIKKNGKFHVEDLVMNPDDILNSKFIRSDFAQIPIHCYTTEVAFSKMSIQSLEWLRHTTGKHIKHALMRVVK